MQEGVSNYLYSKGSTSFIWGNQRSLLWILQFGCQFCLINSFNVHPLSSFLSAEYWLGCWRGNEDIETWIILVCSPYGSCCSGHGHLQSCSECDERFSRDFFDLIISCMVWLVIAQLQSQQFTKSQSFTLPNSSTTLPLPAPQQSIHYQRKRGGFRFYLTQKSTHVLWFVRPPAGSVYWPVWFSSRRWY